MIYTRLGTIPSDWTGTTGDHPGCIMVSLGLERVFPLNRVPASLTGRCVGIVERK